MAATALAAHSRPGWFARLRALHRRNPSASLPDTVLPAAAQVAPTLADYLGAQSITPTLDAQRNELSVDITLHSGELLRVTLAIGRSGHLVASMGGITLSERLLAVNGSELALTRATMPVIAQLLGYFVGLAKGHPPNRQTPYVRNADGKLTVTAGGYGHAVRTAVEGELYSWHVLRKRGALRKHMHKMLSQLGLRAKRQRWWARALANDVQERRTAMFWAVPALEPVVAFHGKRFSNLRPLADQETGTVAGAATYGLIPGLANLPAALLSRDPGQRWRYFAATVSGLPGQLWATLFTGAKWGRKQRDPAAPRYRAKPTWLDNIVGPPVDVAMRLAASEAQGDTPPALLGEIGGRRITIGVSSAIVEYRSFSPLLLARIISDKALEIAARGEPASVLAAIERDSRRLHLACLAFLASPAGKKLSQEQRATIEQTLSHHDQLLSAARTCRDKAGLALARFRTPAAPRRSPKVKNMVWRWLWPSLVSTTVSATAATILGEAAFALLGLPGLATTIVTLWTMRSFHSATVDDKAIAVGGAHDIQSKADQELREAARAALHGNAPARQIDSWTAVRPRRRSFGSYLRQAAKIAPIAGIAAAVSFLFSPLHSLALGLTISSTLGPFTNAAYGGLWDKMVRDQRNEASDIDERVAIRKLFNRFASTDPGDIDPYLRQFSDLDDRLSALMTHIEKTPTRPAWVAPNTLLAAACDAISTRESHVLRRRFVAALNRTNGDPRAVEKFLHELVPDVANKPETARAEAIAAAFDLRHESDLDAVAEADILGTCTEEWLPERLHFHTLFPQASKPDEYLSPTAGSPTLLNDEFIAVYRATVESRFARRPDGRLNVDGRNLALNVRVAADTGGIIANKDPNARPFINTQYFVAAIPRVAEQMQEDIDRIRRGEPPVSILQPATRSTRRTRHSRKPRKRAEAQYTDITSRPGFAPIYQARLSEQQRVSPARHRWC